MKKRKIISGNEFIILQFPATLALSLIANRNENNDTTFFGFLILLYIYWFITIIYCSQNFEDFVIMPSSWWKKLFLFLFYPIGAMMVNMVFMALAIIPVKSTLELFGLL
jgi:hypothetical protein